MAQDTAWRKRAVAAMAAGLLLAGLASCSSSSESDEAETGAPESEASGAVDDSGAASDESESDAAVEPCQWYTAEEMGALLGIEVTMEDVETPQALGRECVYDSAADYTSVTVRPTDVATYDSIKAGAASMDIGGAQVDYPGVGEAAYHNADAEHIATGNASVSMSAKDDTGGVQVELATSGTAIESPERGIEIVAEIATTALGG